MRAGIIIQASTPATASGPLSRAAPRSSRSILSGRLKFPPVIVAFALIRTCPSLWCFRYAHYDYNPSFSDFVPFGGWNKPAIKQYAGDQSFCSAGVDKNYY
jgi:hypothetical protein